MKVSDNKQMADLAKQGGLFTSVEKGTMRVRVIGDVYCVKEHKIKVNGKFRAVACPTECARMAIAAGATTNLDVPPCPLCELGYPVSTSFLAVIVEREYEKDGRIMGGRASVLKKGPQLMGQIQTLLDSKDWGRSGDYDVEIEATGDGFNREYKVTPIPANKCAELSAREKSILEEFQMDADLDEMTTPREYAKIQEIIGAMPEYDESKDEDRKKK